ncbi:MAG: HAMP domain-containing sensor histidine kinase, partial [Proteobacteria bacterium]|nr:HAMP domain-containing sensor histidine kinase [Pseudomonadota bacterium]
MAESAKSKTPFLRSLSARLLVLTIFFVMLGELLIYAPSIARFRTVYLEERIAEARLASIALETTPPAQVTTQLQQKILDFSNTYNIVLRQPKRSILALGDRPPPLVDLTVDLRKTGFLGSIRDTGQAMIQTKNRVMRVIGPAHNDPETIVEVLVDEAPMREAMYAFSNRVLALSIVISLVTASLVYLSLQWLMVAPIHRITESMMAFRVRPQDESVSPKPSSRSDEIGVAQRELAVMQQELRVSLAQKERLASLGSAVAKVNHDLRNSLSTAVLISDRIAESDDPDVKRVVPRLFEAMDRAIALCNHTLNFVKDAGPQVHASKFPLTDLVDDVGAGIISSELGTIGTNGIRWDNQIDAAFEVEADRDQLFRAFTNLGRNAYQAGASTVCLEAKMEEDKIHIDVTDNGPGLPQKARDHLFEPFTSSTRPGGTGLG